MIDPNIIHLSSCHECGAVVSHERTHTEWHEKLVLHPTSYAWTPQYTPIVVRDSRLVTCELKEQAFPNHTHAIPAKGRHVVEGCPACEEGTKLLKESVADAVGDIDEHPWKD
jgi:hypothetical protein